MSEIVRIVIKGASGYGPVDMAYEDKITLTDSSISYEYKPHPMSNPETNAYRKWSYKTTSPEFKEVFQAVADRTLDIINCEDELMACDIGPTEIIVTYDDKHREHECFFCPSEYFREWFLLIKQLVPSFEKTPEVLWTADDGELSRL